MIFNEQEIKFLKLIAKWFEENKHTVTREEAIKESRVKGDIYEVLVQKMLHEGAIDKIESNSRDERYAQFTPLARAVELLREIEAEAAVDIMEQLKKRIRQNPRTAWPVIIFLVLALSIPLVNQLWELLERIVKLFWPK